MRSSAPGAARAARLVAALCVASAFAGALVPAPARAQLFGNDEERRRYSGQADAPAPVAPPPAAAPAAAPSLAPAAKQAAPAEEAKDPEAEKKKLEDLAAAEEAARLALRGREIEQLGSAVRDFEAEVREYRGDVQRIIERTFEERKEKLAGEYERQIRGLEIDERQERLDAIALFERFIATYPDDPKYTPDAMTRLAELYYEKSVDDQQVALAEFEEKVKLGAADENAPELLRSFDKSIALYQQIITKFPEYRLVDSIYYLLGWCLGEQGEPEQARDTFRALIERYPSSKYVPEAWVRIGEYYFDYTGADVDDKLLLAIDAYRHAIEFKESALFDKALYKLGWSYYRLNDFDNGVDAFVRLMDYYAELKARGVEGGGDLQNEAMQYTAISFADEKWGGVQKMVEFFKTRGGGRFYNYELFRKLGDVLFDSTRYREAVEAYRIVLGQNPLAADAPQIQQRIVECFARDQDKPSAFAEREKLVKDYAEGSAWAKANKGDQDVLRQARELVERSLLATAQYHHAQAAEYEKSGGAEDATPDDQQKFKLLALQSYQSAAKAYGEYLKEFPHAKNLYDIQYYHAETLYNSLQFAAAAGEYARVRDSNTDNKYLANAAYYVVLALQKQIELDEQQGLLEHREPCSPDRCKDIASFEPGPIPDVRLRLIEAADVYMRKIPTAEDAPILSYKAGQTYFTYFHFDEARRRYEDVIKRFPEKEVAEYAYEDILISYLLVKDWLNVEQFAGRMLAESKSVQNDPKKLAEKRLLKYGARFNRANAAMSERKWDEAAKLYVSIVDDTEGEAKRWGRWDNADKALYNAATCYKEQRRFDSAMRTYERLFTDYPQSELAKTALFFVAEAAEKAFEFDKAITNYLKLVEYKDSKDRVAALFNAAQLLEALQRYREAADAYKRYSELFPDESDAADQLYQSALIYQRMRDWKGMIDGLTAFIRHPKFGRDPAQSEKVVQAHLKMGHAWRELGNDAQAHRAFADCVSAFRDRKMTPENYLAAQAASEARFWIAEKQFAEFQKMKFDPKGKGAKLQKNMGEQLEKLAKTLEEVKKSYTDVIVTYRWPEWMMASLYRLGFADEQFATKLIESPCPADVKALAGEEGCIEYRIMLEEQMAPINDRAVLAFETAADKASELRIVNDWTKLTMEKVCQYTPTKCKSLKDARAQLIFDAMSPRPLVADASGTKDVQFAAPAAPDAPPAGEQKPLPVVSDVQPRQVAPGANVVVTGSNFNANPGLNQVRIGAVLLKVVAVTGDQITAVVPEGAPSGAITVTTPGGSASTSFAVDVKPASAPGIGSPETVTPGSATAPAPATPVAGTGGAP